MTGLDGHDDLGEAGRVLRPALECGGGVCHWDDCGDGAVDREAAALENADYFAKVFRQCVARAEDIQLLLDEEAGLVADWLLGIADVDDAAGKCDLLDCVAKGFGQPDGFDDDIRSEAVGDLLKAFIH